MHHNKTEELNAFSLNLEKELRESKCASFPSSGLISSRIELICLSIFVPNENFLYYFARNYITNKTDLYSHEEAKLLVFCAPLNISTFILEKLVSVINHEESSTSSERFSPEIFTNVVQTLHTAIEKFRHNKYIFRNAHAHNAENMIPVVLEKFGVHYKDPQITYRETIQPVHHMFALQSGVQANTESLTEEQIREKQLLMVEEYYLRLLNKMTRSKKLSQLVPFIEWAIYGWTTKKIESLETHGKIFGTTYPFFQRAGRELTLPFIKNIQNNINLDFAKLTNPPKEKIAFYLTGDAKTGHIQTFMQLVESTKGTTEEKYCLFLLDCSNKEIIFEKAKSSAFEVIDSIDGTLPRIWSKVPYSLLLMALRNNVTHLVFVSVPNHLGVCSGLFSEFYSKSKIKVKLSYFGMKNYIGFTDPLVTNIKPFGVDSDKIRGSWFTLKYSWHAKLVDESKWYEAQRIKKNLIDEYSASLVIGTIARTERFTIGFVDLVIDVLSARENIIYIYAAQNEVSLFKKHKKFDKVKNKMKYVGFVDIFVYSKIIDLMIDTFPFGSAQVGLHMIANNNAIVTLKTYQTQISSWYIYFKDEIDKLEKNSNLSKINPFPNTIEQFKDTILVLCKSEELLENYKKSLSEVYQLKKDIIHNPRGALQSLLEIIKTFT